MAAEQPLWLPVLSPTMTTRCTATIDCNEALRPDAYLKRDPAAMIAMSKLFSPPASINGWVVPNLSSYQAAAIISLIRLEKGPLVSSRGAVRYRASLGLSAVLYHVSVTSVSTSHHSPQSILYRAVDRMGQVERQA